MSQQKSTRGFALLEQAIAMLAVLSVLAAAIDINAFLQSHNALQTGVERALRCVFPTDGKCTSVQPAGGTSFFKVWQKPIIGNSQDYSGDSFFLKLPSFKFNSPSSRVLDYSEKEYQQNKQQLILQEFPVQGQAFYAEYFRKLPSLSGSNPEKPNFSETPIMTLIGPVGGEVTPVQKNPVFIGTMSFKIAGPFKDYSNQLGNFEKCFDKTNSNTACNEPWKAGMRIAFWIDGSGSFNGNSTAQHDQGKVTLRIRQQGNNHLMGNNSSHDEDYGYALGGRIFNGGVDPDFVPRGIPLDQVPEGFQRYGEFALYPYLWVTYDTEVNLDFYLNASSANQNVRWSAQEVEIFSEGIQAFGDSITCKDKFRQSQIPSLTTCSFSHPKKYVRTNVTAHELHPGDPQAATQTVVYRKGCSPNYLSQSELCDISQNRDHCDEDYTIKTLESENECSNKTLVGPSCPNNYGVSAESQWDPSKSRFFVSDAIEAESICPFAPEQINNTAKLVNAWWFEKDISLAPIDKVYPDKDCDFLANPTPGELPSPYNLYTKLKVGPASVVGSTDHGMGKDTDPRELKKTDPRYQCHEVSLGSAFHQLNAKPDYGCNWADKVRDALVSDGQFPENYFFEAKGKTKTMPLNKNTYYMQLSDRDACTDYTLSAEIKDITHRKYLGIFEGGSYPKDCTPRLMQDPNQLGNASDWCLFETYADIQNTNPQTPDLKLDLAKENASDAISTLFPQAKLNCTNPSDPYCVTLSVDMPLDAGSGKHIATARASMKIPIHLIPGLEIPLQVSQSRAWEAEMAR